MADSSDKILPESSNPPTGAPASRIAPPPTEISIRTTASDLASIKRTGGGPPEPTSISLPALLEREKGAEPAGAAGQIEQPSAPQPSQPVPYKPLSPAAKSVIFVVSALLVAVAIFWGSYYFLYPLVPKKSSQPAAVLTASSTASAALTFQHQSFFKQPTDGTLILKISSSTSSFKENSRQLAPFLSALGASSTLLFEIVLQSPANQPIPAADFFSLIKADILDRDFLVSDFNQDFTLFLYKDKNGLWPGYILQLKTTQNPLLLRDKTRQIENVSSSWSSIFLQPPTIMPAAQFQDALVAGQPVRVLNSEKGAALSYGWFFNKYLIISTSLDGLKQALGRL